MLQGRYSGVPSILETDLTDYGLDASEGWMLEEDCVVAFVNCCSSWVGTVAVRIARSLWCSIRSEPIMSRKAASPESRGLICCRDLNRSISVERFCAARTASASVGEISSTRR